MNNVKIGKETKIDKTTKFYGKVVIGDFCIIGPNNIIKNSIIGNHNIIDCSYIEDSIIENQCRIGPFSHIRNNSLIQSNCRIGNYVEIKKSLLHPGVKCAHLSYIGDAEIGDKTNVGCGVVIANYDGKKKNKTFIGQECFIGCKSILIAPIFVEDNCFIAAGTIVSKYLKKDSFAIRRSQIKITKKSK